MSAAVIPMRMIVSAPAIRGSPAAEAIPSMTAAVIARLFPDFSIRIAVNPFPTFDDYLLCTRMQRPCQWREIFSQIAVAAQFLVTANDHTTQAA
jgi:hypothetical protein